MTKDRWVKLGVVGVDSGQLLIMDPCYVEGHWDRGNDKDEFGGGTYSECCKLTLSKNHGGQLKFMKGHPGLGVAFSSGVGDGVYEVNALVGEAGDWGERIKEVRIKLI